MQTCAPRWARPDAFGWRRIFAGKICGASFWPTTARNYGPARTERTPVCIPATLGSSMFKNLIDRSLAALTLCLLSPLLLVLACLIWLRLGNPVLLRQTRIGFKEKPFTILKFRTMTDDCDSRGTLLHDTLRITRLGRFLRAWSLDELPQLWNVLRGDMALVGPRPLLHEFLPPYHKCRSRRHEVKPGITGWAQVNGRNGPQLGSEAHSRRLVR